MDRINPISCSKDCIQTISAMALAKALYSNLILDCEIITCFLELQDIRLGLKNTRKPLVERRSSVQPTQSESEYALSKDYV
jgi:hypothetical protein